MMNGVKPVVVCSFTAWLLLCYVGCRASDVGDAAVASSTVVALTPVATIAAGAYASDAAAQNSSIVVGAPKQWYSEKITKSELGLKGVQYGCKFHEPWKYMGTKNGAHYLALYPFLGFREIYRIDEAEYLIEEPFALTSRSSKWRDITVFSHHGVEHPLIIEPFLLEHPEGIEPFGVDVIQLNSLGGDVEALFMQDVQILEE